MSFESATPTGPVHDVLEPEERKLETGKKVYAFLERTTFLVFRKDDAQFDAWLKQLSYEQFKDHLTRLNGMLREVPIKKRKMDGQNVEISSQQGDASRVAYAPPAFEQRDGMMRDAFLALQQMTDNEDRGLLMYYALQAIHPYGDGNGRTGRLLHELFSEHGRSATRASLSELLDHETAGSQGTGAGRERFQEQVMNPADAYAYLNREVAKEALGEPFMQEYGAVSTAVGPSGIASLPASLKQQLTPQESAKVEKVLSETDQASIPISAIVLQKFISEYPEFKSCETEGKLKIERAHIVEDNGKKVLSINIIKKYGELTPAHVRRLIEIHKEMKTVFIRSLIDSFAHPEKHQVKTADGKTIPLKDVFRSPVD